MFDCGSSQFLAIEEALSDSNRRIGMPTPAATQYEVEVLDGTLELFFAAEHIVNGLLCFKQIKTSIRSETQLVLVFFGEIQVEAANFPCHSINSVNLNQ